MIRRLPIIVAVDGPAGSGKSSICHQVAQRLGWSYVNTGAIYRAISILAQDRGLNLDDAGALTALIETVAPGLRWDAGRQELWYNETDLTPRLQSEAAGTGASRLAKLAGVRARLLPVQRAMALAAPRGVLVDGRDIGTVVFPEADLKIFLTASLEARSRRRLQQLGACGDDPCAPQLTEVMAGLANRDERDTARDTAPLKQSQDAVVLDTSNLTFTATIEAMLSLLRERQLA